MSLAEVDSLTAEEFHSWCAYFEVEPWGTHALEILIAQLCQITWGASGAKNPPRMEQLMPFSQMRAHIGKKPKGPQELYRKAATQAQRLGIKVNKNGSR